MSAWMAVSLLRRLEVTHGLVLPDANDHESALCAVSLASREAAFRQGEPCPYVFVVRSGLLKRVYTEKDGSEWIKSFAGPGDLFTCIYALDRKSPTTFSSVAIEHSVVERVDYRYIEAKAEQSIAWQKALRIAFQLLAEIKVRRERDLLTLTPRELYRQLSAHAPRWIDRVPQKDLAAYLGVTPVGLNRIVRDESKPGTRHATV